MSVGPAPSAARERILDAASAAFYARGLGAVGVDAIVEEAGVAKATLYRHFRTKDDLVVAFLRRRDERWRAWLRDAVERLAAGRPAERRCACSTRSASGSPPRSSAAAPSSTPPRRSPTRRTRPAARSRITRAPCATTCATCSTDAGSPDPGDDAGALLLLVEGAIISAVIEGDPSPAARAPPRGRARHHHHRHEGAHDG